MVSPKWFLVLFSLMLLLTFINGIIEEVYLGGIESTFGTLIGTDMGISDRMGALWSALWFDYAMFTGEWLIVRYLFMCISAAVIISIVISIVSNISSFAMRFFTGGV